MLLFSIVLLYSNGEVERVSDDSEVSREAVLPEYVLDALAAMIGAADVLDETLPVLKRAPVLVERLPPLVV